MNHDHGFFCTSYSSKATIAYYLRVQHLMAILFCNVDQVMDGFEMVRRYRAVELQRAQELAEQASTGTSLYASTSADRDEPTAVGGVDSISPAAISNCFSRAAMAIVGMSANSDLASQSLAADAGMNFFLAKPFSFADINAVLCQFK
jgi:CheY-like chemotaxis protein